MILLGDNFHKRASELLSMAKKKITQNTESLERGDTVFFHSTEARIEAAKLAAESGFAVREDALNDFPAWQSCFPGLMFDGQEIIPASKGEDQGMTVEEFLQKINAKQ
jgi:hypothetical protein